MRTNNNSIVKDMFNLQIGLGKKEIHRFRGKILKKLICSTTREFEKVCYFHIRGPSFFTLLHCGRLFMQNREAVNCYSAYKNKLTYTEYNQKKMFSFPMNSHCKDLVLWSPDSPLGLETLLANNDRHSTSMLYVTSTSYLIRRCALSGKLQEKIFLSPLLRFTEMQCDSESDVIVLKSTRHQRDDSFMTFAVFDSPPLQFQAMFELKRSVFGKKAVDGGIQQGILFIRYSDNKVKLYSLRYILSEYTERQYQLGDALENGIVGQKPSGLPLTVQINEEPPVLLEVVTNQGDFTIGGNPWHYLTKPDPYVTLVHKFGCNKLVASIDTPNCHVEAEHVFFHPDESNRLIHMSNNFFKISWIGQNSLQPWLHYTVPIISEQKESDSEHQVSRYGRTLKRTFKNTHEEEEQLAQDLSLVYDSDTDLLAMLRVCAGSSGENLTLDEVLLFDNATGNIAKTVNLEKLAINAPFELSVFNLVLDGPNFLATAKHKNNTFGLLCTLSEQLEGEYVS